MSRRAESLAERIEEGAACLAAFVEGLSEDDWRTPVSAGDARTVGVVVHHVASVYRVEVELAREVAAGRAVTEVTWEAVAEMNAGHARQQAGVTKEEAMRRAQGEPRVESYDYRKWKEQRRAQAKANQWETGHWDVPYQHKAEAVEQAFRIVELCAKSFQRAARQLANIRLVRAKTVRTRRRERAKVIKGVRVA